MVDHLVKLAEAAFQAGELLRLKDLCEEILDKSPKNPQATLLTGMAATRDGDNEKAVEWLRRALVLSPNDSVAVLWLLLPLRALGRTTEAIEVGEQARKLWPERADLHAALALDYFKVKDYQRAEECLRAAIRLEPKNPSFHRRLGSLFEAQGRDDDAKQAYENAIKVAPDHEESYSHLGRLLVGHGNFSQAIELCETALKLVHHPAQIHLILAQALRGVRDDARAEAHLQQAILWNPRIVLAAALWLNEDGRFEEAGALFRRSIEQHPRQGVAYFGLVKSRKMTSADSELIEQMESLLTESLPPKEEAALHYALGKSADDRRQFERAMKHFDAANRLKYQIYLEGREFDPRDASRHREQIEATFTPELMSGLRVPSPGSDVPIFIIGMIRSGTTLLEQIVASHPMVGGAGEQRFWVTEAQSIVDLSTSFVDAERLAEAKERYLKVLRGLQPESPRITDKMPLNFYCAGLLHMAFPDSPILHIRRNPVDTALSIYMTDLAKPPEFAHDKKNIVFAYREYEKTMEIWRRLIPSDRLMEIRYEDLIADQETWTRRIIEFCGLPWDPACLEFHKSERAVSTPSMWQVRQPIYRTSVEKWRNYEPWLDEFAELIDRVDQA